MCTMFILLFSLVREETHAVIKISFATFPWSAQGSNIFCFVVIFLVRSKSSCIQKNQLSMLSSHFQACPIRAVIFALYANLAFRKK